MVSNLELKMVGNVKLIQIVWNPFSEAVCEEATIFDKILFQDRLHRSNRLKK
jgi:hypothetical protein